MSNYKVVVDGWYNQVSPVFVDVTEDHFFPETLNVSISFKIEDGAEQPKADIPLLYSAEHMIADFDGFNKTGEHKATEKDQREAFAYLGRLFPEWEEFCKGAHTTQEKLYWFVDNRTSVMNKAFDIKVRHSLSGFCSCRVKDPAAPGRKPKERTTKTAALTRAAAAFASVFGGGVAPAAANAAATAAVPDESDIPF